MLYKVPPLGFFAKTKLNVVICFCLYEEKMLFLRRSSGNFLSGKWTAPGGKKEKKETSLQGIRREMFEETGLILKQEIFEDMGVYYIEMAELSYSLQIFKAQLNSFPQKIMLSPREHDQYKWVTKEEALCLPLVPEADQCLLAAFSSR